MVQSKHFTFSRGKGRGRDKDIAAQFEHAFNEWMTAHPNLTRIQWVLKVPSMEKYGFIVIYDEVAN